MSYPAWPAALPQYPIRDSYKETAAFPVVQAQVDGPPLSRRRYTAAPVALTCVYEMSGAAFDAWEAFYATDIKFGALSYTAPLRATGGTAVHRVTAAPQYVRLGADWWSVSLSLIRLP